jgi:hypothetical protein
MVPGEGVRRHRLVQVDSLLLDDRESYNALI